MWFDPSKPMHDRYQVRHDFLTPELGDEIVSISRLVNAFFRWEFNSCETIVKDGVAYPIDYANASPDVALTSLHYYFPWAIMALVRWSAFCAITRREMLVNQNSRDYFEWGDRTDLSYDEKLAAYRRLADDVLPGRRLRGVLRHAPGAPAGDRARVVHLGRVRRRARRDGAGDVPGARAGAVRGALPRPARSLGRRQRDVDAYPGRMTETAILVVDDDAPIRRMLDRTLAAEGYAVESVADGGAGARRRRAVGAGPDRARREHAGARRAGGLPAAAREGPRDARCCC